MAVNTNHASIGGTSVPLDVPGGLYVNGTQVIDTSGNVLTSISGVDLTVSGNTILGNAVTDTTAINGATTITTTSASGLTVGANGATNPVLKVACSTASVATGISITGAAAAGGVAIAAISSGTNENLIVDAKGSGTVTVGSVSTGNISLARPTGVTGPVTITSAGASALAVGLGGATNPALQVDASTASSATGIKVKSAAAAGGVEVSVISSGTDENLTINAKGAGTITLGTGDTYVSSYLYATKASVIASTEGTPAGGAAGVRIGIGSAGVSIYLGSGAPSVSALKGSLYLRTDGSTTNDRMYVNTDGGTTWTAVITAA